MWNWLIFLFVASGAGTACMTLTERMGANVWAARGIGCVAAVIAGLTYEYFFGRKKDADEE